MKALLFFGFFLITAVYAAELPVFRIDNNGIENIVVDATPNEPWIISITLTESKLSEYRLFTERYLERKISLVVAGIEIYQPDLYSVVDSNPITIRIFDKGKLISILSALSSDSE